MIEHQKLYLHTNFLKIGGYFFESGPVPKHGPSNLINDFSIVKNFQWKYYNFSSFSSESRDHLICITLSSSKKLFRLDCLRISAAESVVFSVDMLAFLALLKLCLFPEFSISLWLALLRSKIIIHFVVSILIFYGKNCSYSSI